MSLVTYLGFNFLSLVQGDGHVGGCGDHQQVTSVLNRAHSTKAYQGSMWHMLSTPHLASIGLDHMWSMQSKFDHLERREENTQLETVNFPM